MSQYIDRLRWQRDGELYDGNHAAAERIQLDIDCAVEDSKRANAEKLAIASVNPIAQDHWRGKSLSTVAQSGIENVPALIKFKRPLPYFNGYMTYRSDKRLLLVKR